MYRPLLMCTFSLMLCGCAPEETAILEQSLGTDADAGRRLTYRYACGSCHEIPGVPAADGAAGPTLDGVAGRRYIAGSLPNTPSNMARWIAAPQDLEPGSAMPNIGVTELHARDIATFLYTLK